VSISSHYVMVGVVCSFPFFVGYGNVSWTLSSWFLIERLKFRYHVLSTLCDKVCQSLVADRWFTLGTPVSSTNKTDHHDITVILLKVALTAITLTLSMMVSGDVHENSPITTKRLVYTLNVIFQKSANTISHVEYYLAESIWKTEYGPTLQQWRSLHLSRFE